MRLLRLGARKKGLPFPGESPMDQLPFLPKTGALVVGTSSPSGAHSFQTIESFPFRDFLIKTFLFALALDLRSELLFPSPSLLGWN